MSGPRLSIIPARAATDPALKPRDLQVLCVLGRHTDDLGWCRKSQVKMADEMGCARSTVFDAIERLVKAGYIERHVQEEESGRDSPHVYRVILDLRHPDPAAVKDADSEVADPCRQAGTPADISAPPAGPEAAPPAGPGPAPKNDPLRTAHQNEKESAGEDGTDESQKALKRAFKRAYAQWPTFVADDDALAWSAFLSCSPEERQAGLDRQADYIASVKKAGRTTFKAYSSYWRKRMWEKLPPPRAEQPASTDYAPPFGPVWSAFVVGTVLLGEDDGRVGAIYRLARGGSGFRFGERWQRLKASMVAVPVGSETFEDWRAEFERRGWPWIPDPGSQPVVFFPAGGPDGLAGFEAAVRGQDGHGDQRQAAE